MTLKREPADVEAEIMAILTEFLSKPQPLSGATDLVSDLGLESVQVMEFVMEVEDHYDIALDLESLSHVRTIAQLTELVVRSLD
jgi:acyl carrier protein